MNCNRCFAKLFPTYNNIKELKLKHLDINVRLNKLDCTHCRICFYIELTNNKWIHIDTISMEKEPKKNGWQTIKGPNELIKFYVLSQIICNQIEERFDEKNVFFEFPDENDLVKILWENGRAIGFYTVLPNAFPESIVFATMESYEMNTLDTAYVRKQYRGRGFGVSIFQDLMNMFPEEDIGLSTPISTSMYYAVLKFLSINPVYKTKLWEISGVGSEGNRKLIYFSIRKFFNI